jgi:hypothetical protein
VTFETVFAGSLCLGGDLSYLSEWNVNMLDESARDLTGWRSVAGNKRALLGAVSGQDRPLPTSSRSRQNPLRVATL